MTESDSSIFISYANADQSRVTPFCDYLVNQGFNVWIDCRCLKPGQNWEFEIRREIDKAAFVLIFVSQNSFDRRGYVQRELKLAIDKLNEKLIDDIYIIPILLDDAPIPPQLRGIQHIKASEPNCNERIADAIRHQQQRVGKARNAIQKNEGIVWESQTFHEASDGAPGYDVRFDWLAFRSERFPKITEITDYIKGRLLLTLFQHRQQTLEPASEFYNFEQDKFFRTNTYDAHCGEPILIGKIISVQYSVSWYGAGAVHSNYHFLTFNFLLEPLVLINSLSQLFKEPEKALVFIQSRVREALYPILASGKGDQKITRDWIDEGTSKWDCFDNFIFKDKGIEILFAPYQVASFAEGPQSASLSIATHVPQIRDEYVDALNARVQNGSP